VPPGGTRRFRIREFRGRQVNPIDLRDRHDERREWRFDRERHEHRWGERDYGYDVPSYGVAPPPLVYAPPPPGINFLFSSR
jgi:hypothetical protein